jgi:hypothetical protein
MSLSAFCMSKSQYLTRRVVAVPKSKRVRVKRKQLKPYHSDSEDESEKPTRTVANSADSADANATNEASVPRGGDQASGSVGRGLHAGNAFASALQLALLGSGVDASGALGAADATAEASDAILSGVRTAQQKQAQRMARSLVKVKSKRALREETLARNHVTVPRTDEREKRLAKLAASGVVVLFNTLKRQRAAWKREMKKQAEAPVATSMFDDKPVTIRPAAFLDTLAADKQTQRAAAAKKRAAAAAAASSGAKSEPKWSVLRDDFLETKQAAWDADNSDDAEE